MTQARSAAADLKGNLVPMVAGDFGDIVTLDLVVPDDSAVALSTAADYPARPVVLAWMLQNLNIAAGAVAYVSGSGVEIGRGVFLGKRANPTAEPSTIALLTDPGKTFIIQNSGGPVTYLLTLCGRDLGSPAP